MSSAPTQVRHYYRDGRGPFLNLSDLDSPALEEVVDVLNAEGRSGDHQRVFGRRYMVLRRRTEQKLRAKFVEIGGQPERDAPHYFVLGESRWFEGLALDMKSVVLDVADLPDQATSFTSDLDDVSGGEELIHHRFQPVGTHEQRLRFSVSHRDRMVRKSGECFGPREH